MKQVTIYDIAKEAKVSAATVSRVLNNTAPVKESTRSKIMQIIHKYQFQPNALARSLLKKETGTIGVIMPDITNPFFPEVFSGIDRAASEMGYTFFLCDTLGDTRKESQYLHMLREKQVDGILFLGGRINLSKCDPELAEEVVETASRIPTVLINGNLPGTSLHRVILNEAKGAEMATQFLIDAGHRSIAFIAGNEEMTTTAQKVRAFRRVMKKNGLEAAKDSVLYGDYSMASGESSMEKILARRERPTAVFCVNDLTAVGALKAAMKAGVSVPDEVSVIGFDDIPLASAIYPELTTVSQRMDLLGGTGVQVLHKMILKEKVKMLTVIEPELVVRNSTRNLR
ncbi:LacI family DNA-binding transcriptional regulator [Paenibacillus ihbetae]|uniref:LacI family transcriptional regulator n=1 Tax=Paenibacillus ihbetae TaxID=1870820 RepID=A0A1B2E713_9BACL|nr:LacI family DNA-binding transcriptional regulator [Paenibacillus ihbetae]ANY75764.1 LacI family transcriptional regulator [Paenibacillus ihbetae]OOC62068.1 LacI family transcriptional regulator [Paenibacillus ihbetae]